MKVAGVVLAAGGSTRFGDNNKLLAPLQGRSLVSYAVDALQASPVEAGAVVLGHEAEAVRATLCEFDGVVLFNAQWAAGMATSLHCAVRWARDHAGASHLLVMLGDMPFVTAAHISSLTEKAVSHPTKIVRAVHGGTAGNPVIVPARAFDALLALRGDEGARALVRQGFATVDVELDDAVRTDIDTPDALAGVIPRV